MNTPPRTDSFPNPHNGPLKALVSHPNMTPTAPLTPPQEPSEGHHEPPKFLIGGDEHTPCGTVPEEDEDHDNETSSSIAEPVTPPAMDNLEPVSSKRASMTNMVQPTIVNVPPTPPSKTPLKGSPPSSQVNLKRSTSRLSTLFRRSTSNANMNTLKTTDKTPDPSSPHTAAPLSPRIIKNRHSFFHTSTTTNTPVASAANTPPAEPSSTVVQVSQDLALSKQKTNVAQPQPRSRLGRNRRASSMNGIPQMLKAASDEDKITAIPDFTRPAPTGVGLKSRRISIAAPRVKIEVGPLSAKYTSASHVPLKSKTIGSGATAVVKLFKKINAAPGDETIYAVKEYRHRSSSETEQEFSDKVNSEYTLSHSLHHPNVVETFDLCMSSGHRWCAVMEYCGGGDLFSLIEARFMGEAEKLCVFKQMMRGIAYLHNHGIAHRDIKPENLLMREDGHLKITDFGVSEVFTGEHPGAAGLQCGVGMTEEIRLSKPGICGSEPYLSPEVLSKKDDYDPRKLDVWAAGCVTLIVHHHGLPWLRASRDDAFYTKYADAWDKWTAKNPDQIITDDNYPNGSKVLNSLDSKCLKRILLRMMHPDPTKRVTANDVLNDRWVKNIECCTLDHADDHTPGKIDCSKKSSCKNISKMGVKRMHQHTPPQNHRHSGFFHHH